MAPQEQQARRDLLALKGHRVLKDRKGCRDLTAPETRDGLGTYRWDACG